MAILPQYPNIAVPIAPPDSDYGSDIDDATADELFSQAESQPLKERVIQSVEQPATAELEEDVYTHNYGVRLARLRQSLNAVESRAKLESIAQSRQSREAAIEVEYDESNRGTFSPSNPEETATKTLQPELKQPKKDTRSPLQRFKARRPLSVTNLVSPSWCEQQYEYNLSHHGRIPQTKAMTQGSSVHKELEEQVHVEVPVEVVSREDRHGLKMWNTIQGLRALRETGLTRELEVWGVLEGEVVNGIIDEVAVECPDAEMEMRVLEQLEGGKKGKGPQLAPDQRTLTEFLTGSQGASVLERGSMLEREPTFLRALTDRPNTTYYLKDVKTTKRERPPAHPAYIRGAHVQLMLYHRMLSSLAASEVSAQQVFDRYRLNANANFSDKFIAELANLDMRAFISVPDEVDLPLSQRQQDPLGELLGHNTLASLWTLLISELQWTFPSVSSTNKYSSISPLLTVEYRNTSPHNAGQDTLIGMRSFPLDAKQIDAYVKDEIRWWRGERETVGVSVEDAWKCGWCEFAGVCEWRARKVEEGLERARLRREGLGERSGV